VSDARLEVMNPRPYDKNRMPHATPAAIPRAEAASRAHTGTALKPQTNDKKKPAQAAGVDSSLG
jgi:hypothetical protein